ncbi:MAG TPA: hypothetical protein VMU81_30100 [Acetobacteraceae bacterium]|jgi:AraC-like DNA-binding protein|nr:hypothetical protein [Acetobacteraceae bacterium]
MAMIRPDTPVKTPAHGGTAAIRRFRIAKGRATCRLGFMLGSSVSVFGEVEDCRKALAMFGCTALVLTKSGTFHARVTCLALHNIWLLRLSESLARIATYKTSSDMRRFVLPPATGHLFWGGVEATAGSLLSHGPETVVFERTLAPVESLMILVSERLLAHSVHTLIGSVACLRPDVFRWNPRSTHLARLRALHFAATGMSAERLAQAHGASAYWGLEQELIYALADCLSDMPSGPAVRQPRHVPEPAQQLAAMIAGSDQAHDTAAAICRRLSLSPSVMHRSCMKHFGVSPGQYIRLIRKQTGGASANRCDR